MDLHTPVLGTGDEARGLAAERQGWIQQRDVADELLPPDVQEWATAHGAMVVYVSWFTAWDGRTQSSSLPHVFLDVDDAIAWTATYSSTVELLADPGTGRVAYFNATPDGTPMPGPKGRPLPAWPG
ncbi:MAG: hypothetical protein ACLGIR_04150 [Actinomycetes bacterium]